MSRIGRWSWMLVLLPQTVGALTLPEAIDRALVESPLLSVQRQAVAQAEASHKEAVGAFLPSVTASGRYGRSPGEAFFQGFSFSVPDENYSFSTTVRLPLFAGFRNVSRLEVARSTGRAADADFSRAGQEVVLSTCQRFLEVLKRKRLSEVAVNHRQRSEEQLERVEALFEVGRAPQVDLLRQRGQLGTDRLTEIDARDALDNARNDLNVSIGAEISDRKPLADVDLDIVIPVDTDAASLTEVALRRRSDVRAARARVEEAVQSVRVARSGRYPTLDAFADKTWNWSEKFAPDEGSFQRSESHTVGVSASLPIFDQWVTHSAIDRAEARGVYEKATLRTLEREVRREISDALLALRNAQERVEVADGNLVVSREELRIATERYDVGAGTLLDRNLAAAAFSGAEADLVSARHDLYVAVLQLSFVQGIDIRSDVGMVE